ncbi:NAD(+) synthetase [Candidatus Hepatincolaceae symbiont of Richtersius coronifer]
MPNTFNLSKPNDYPYNINAKSQARGSKNIRLAVFQMQAKVGNIQYNLDKIINFYQENSHQDLVLTPELALSGYSPQDDLYSKDFHQLINEAINQISSITQNSNATLLLGTPYFKDNLIFNAVLVITSGKVQDIIYKSKLPYYGVFNEHRYFTAANEKYPTNNIIKVKNYKVGIFICEDMWHLDKCKEIMAENPDLLISINASPFEIDHKINKNENRLKVVKNFLSSNIPLIYINLVGGQDEVVFDGSSFIYQNNNDNLKTPYYLGFCHEDYCSLEFAGKAITIIKPANHKPFTGRLTEDLIYTALMVGTRDFIKGNDFKGVLLGISGGIDSTLTATLVADTLGPENVMGISMPSIYTSDLSKDIVKEIQVSLGILIHEVPIDNAFNAYKESLKIYLEPINKPNQVNEGNNVLENLQARIRGQILMAFANVNSELMVLTTANKSENSTGYATLYGDTCGAFNVIKDLYKRNVYALSKWRNSNIPAGSLLPKLNVIPERAISRAPSAELHPNQVDAESLMEYDILDTILYGLIEANQPLAELYQQFDKAKVDKVIKLIKNSHYKRAQAAVGIKVSPRALGREFQYALTNDFKINNTLKVKKP